MSYSGTIKAALNMAGLKQQDAAAALGISPQAFRNKLARGSFSCGDLVTVATVCGYCLSFTDQNGRAVVQFQPPEETNE